jgi:hypothetical protein
MKLTRLLIVFSGLSLAFSLAWSQVVINAPDASAGVTSSVVNGQVVVTGSSTLTNPAGGLGSQTGITGNLGGGNATTVTPAVQGTVGGPGGPSGVSGTYLTNLGGNSGPGTGLLNSSHDFTANALANAPSVGLCTFCHTPHKASSTLLLWNHTMSSSTFQWDVAATTAGTALPSFSGTSYKGPSAKCLSCHDGSVSLGDVSWFNQAPRTGSASLNPGGISNVKFQVGRTNRVAGNMAGTHPVAIPYPLNGAPNVYNGSTSGARLATNDFVTDPTANNIRLYSDVGGGQIVGKVQAGKTGIECSSCHDVHNKAANDVMFLRGKLVGSSLADGYLCLQCHVK